MICDKFVSVIIPTYNSAISLCRAIDSALSQEHKPSEIIVINDGSTDDTPNVVKNYGDNIIYIEQDNQGQGSARNAGLKVATGRFVAFLDADDYWHPGFLKRCVDFLEEHEEAVAVSTGVITKQWKKPDRYWPPIDVVNEDERFEECVLDNFFRFWARYDHVTTGSNVIRRDIIKKAGYQLAKLRISQDLEYWAYIATFGKWGFVPEHLWIGDSCRVASKQGWLKKYHKRRKLCPTVEQWEKRILNRISESDFEYFKVARGRVASGYLHAKVIAGDSVGAKHIVKKYGNEMVGNKISNILKYSLAIGSISWWIMCTVIRLREYLKRFR